MTKIKETQWQEICVGNDSKDHWMKNDGTGKECFQSLFCHWCQTC